MAASLPGAHRPVVATACVSPAVRRLLRCPVTGEELVDVSGPHGEPGLLARQAGLLYPVRSGVPLLLPGEAVSLRG